MYQLGFLINPNSYRIRIFNSLFSTMIFFYPFLGFNECSRRGLWECLQYSFPFLSVLWIQRSSVLDFLHKDVAALSWPGKIEDEEGSFSVSHLWVLSELCLVLFFRLIGFYWFVVLIWIDHLYKFLVHLLEKEDAQLTHYWVWLYFSHYRTNGLAIML